MNINLSAPINTLSYGLVSVNILSALDKLGHEVALWPIGPIETHPKHHEIVKKALSRQGMYSSVAPSLRIFHQNSLAEHIGRGIQVGFPIFELNKFTSIEENHLRQQDRLIVCSEWAASLVRSLNPITFVAPLGIDHDIFKPQPVKERSSTIFMNVGKWEYRKGHDVLCTAFNTAFSKDDDVQLVLLCSNPFLTPTQQLEWESYFKKSPLGDKITIIKERSPTQEPVAALMAQADCGVFPSRAEGWNLDLAEMMAMGKTVIATHYSAHTQFCTEKNSLLIYPSENDEGDSLTEDAFDGVWFKGQGEWMDFGPSQMNQLIGYMRAVHSDKQGKLLGVNQEGIEMMKRHNWENTARAVVEALQ